MDNLLATMYGIFLICLNSLELRQASSGSVFDKSTMIAIITPLVIFSALVLVDGECHTNSGPIDSCCCLGYNNNHFNAKASGVYTVANFCGVKCSNVKVYCDAVAGGGGWMVILRRGFEYSTNFHREWTEYEDGFGSLYKEFWLGLRSMHCLTTEGHWELRIDFTFENGTKSYLHYNSFKIGPPEDRYRLGIAGFTGITPTDPFTTSRLNGRTFKTLDQPQGSHCPINGHTSKAPGGWWYGNCLYINLNYNYGGPRGFINIDNAWYSPTFIEMKIRPVGCQM